MAALLLEDVTVRRGDQVTLHVRFRGGTATTLTVPRSLTAWERRWTLPAVLTTIDALLADHTDAEVVALLNAQGLAPGPASSSLAIASSGPRRQGIAEFSPPPAGGPLPHGQGTRHGPLRQL